MKKYIAPLFVAILATNAYAADEANVVLASDFAKYPQCKVSLSQNFKLTYDEIYELSKDDGQVSVKEFRAIMENDLLGITESAMEEARAKDSAYTPYELKQEIANRYSFWINAMDKHLDQCAALIPGVAKVAEKTVADLKVELAIMQGKDLQSIDEIVAQAEKMNEMTREGSDQAEKEAKKYRRNWLGQKQKN